MLRFVRRPPPWPPTGYVCRPCRHQLQTARRLQSSTAANIETDGGTDDWYSNFNDTSDKTERIRRSGNEKEDQSWGKSVESRRTGSLEPQDEPRTRRLPRDHAGIIRCARLPKRQLERKIQKWRDQMRKIRQKPTNAEPAAETPSMKDREDIRTLYSHIGIYERALEVQREGNLADQPRQTAFVRSACGQSDRRQVARAQSRVKFSIFADKGLEYDKSNADLAKMMKDLEYLKVMLAARSMATYERLGLSCTAVVSASTGDEIASWAKNETLPVSNVIQRKLANLEYAIAIRMHGHATADKMLVHRRTPGSRSTDPGMVPQRSKFMALRQQYETEFGEPWMRPMPISGRGLEKNIKMLQKKLAHETSANDSTQARTTRGTQDSTDRRKLGDGTKPDHVKLDSIVADLKTTFLDNVRQSPGALLRDSSLDALRQKLETEAPGNEDRGVNGASSINLRTEGASPTDGPASVLEEPTQEPRTRRLPANHTAVAHLKSKPREELEALIERAHAQLEGVRQSVKDAAQTSQPPPAYAGRDIKMFSSHIGLFERVIELRDADSVTRRRQTAFVRNSQRTSGSIPLANVWPTSEQSLDQWKADLQLLESSRTPGKSESIRARGALIRRRIKLYKKWIAKREPGDGPGGYVETQHTNTKSEATCSPHSIDSNPHNPSRDSSKSTVTDFKTRRPGNLDSSDPDSVISALEQELAERFRSKSRAGNRIEISLEALKQQLEIDKGGNSDKHAVTGIRAELQMREDLEDKVESASRDQETDQADVTRFFADSPAELAELQSAPPAPTAPTSAPISEALVARETQVRKAYPARDTRTAQISEGSPGRERSPAKGLDELLRMLNVRIDQDDGDDRQRAVESNIKNYEKSIDDSQQGEGTGQSNASFSLRRLHRTFGLQSAPETKERPRPPGDETDPSGPAKPAKTGGRKSRRNRMAQRSEHSAAKPAASNPSAMGDNGDDGEDDDHVPLWKVMEESEAAPAAEEPTPMAKVESAQCEQPETGSRPLSTVKATDLHIDALDIPQPPVPSLEYGLDKVLFNPGVYQLQDPTSRVYNFDPYLEHIMPAIEFDFNALKEYKTSSEDRVLSAIAKQHSKKYIGSTSSMTSTLAHFHYLLSNWRSLNLDMLSRGFVDQADEFTKINRAPTAIFLRWKPESKTYAIDADKEHDSPNVLMMLGKSMEKLLTMPTSDFERYRKSDPRDVSDEMRNEPEAFQYTTMGDFLMRSQLDAYDSRLPGTGMFDLKTRAALPVRMDAQDFEPMLGYEIHTLQGRWNSYEREYYDMMRSTMLKYMLQARMGRMQGIFAAYHNVQRIFGFQYISIMDMDRALHGQIDPCLGDQEFKMSLDLLNAALNKATAKFPEKSLRIHFETVSQNLGGESTPVMHIFAEPIAEKEIQRIQNLSKDKVREFEHKVMGIEQKQGKPASAETAAAEDEPEDQAPTEYPPATPEPPSEPPEPSQTEGEEDSVPTTYPPATPEPASAPSPNPDFNSSTSAADADFLSSLGPSPTTSDPATPNSTLAPLFAATLMTKSYVNGRHVARPAPLKPDDDWTVEYLLEEYPVREAEWARYEAVKGRRKEVLVREREEEVGVEGEGKKKDGFIEFLRNLAGQGREFRRKIDAAEAGRAKKVAWEVGGGGDRESAAAAAAAASTRGAERDGEVEDVGAYMEWLYNGGKQA